MLSEWDTPGKGVGVDMLICDTLKEDSLIMENEPDIANCN